MGRLKLEKDQLEGWSSLQTHGRHTAIRKHGSPVGGTLGGEAESKETSHVGAPVSIFKGGGLLDKHLGLGNGFWLGI